MTRNLNVFISFFHLLKRMSLQHTFTYESDVKEVGEEQGKNPCERTISYRSINFKPFWNVQLCSPLAVCSRWGEKTKGTPKSPLSTISIKNHRPRCITQKTSERVWVALQYSESDPRWPMQSESMYTLVQVTEEEGTNPATLHPD